MKEVEWKIKSVIKNGHAMIAIESTYHSEKKRVVSEINIPMDALGDVIKECKKLKEQLAAT